MTRRLSEQNRHFLTAKRRIDSLSSRLSREESLQAVELAGDSIGVTDTASLSASTLTIDDFERGNLYPWSGAKGGDYWTATTNSSLAGTYGAEAVGDSNNTSPTITSMPGDGLPNYPERGDSFEYLFQFNDDNQNLGVQFGLQDSGDRYEISTTDFFGDDEFAIKEPSGNVAKVTRTYSTNLVYRVRVDWEADDTIRARLYDTSTSTKLEDISGTASAGYATGGVGLDMNTGGNGNNNGVPVYVDDWVLV